MEGERNIFDAASKMGSDKKHSNKKRKEDTSHIKSKGNDDIERMFDRMNEMQRDLEQKLDEVVKKGRLYRIDVEKYLNDSSHFSREEWEKIQKDKQDLTKKISFSFGRDMQTNSSWSEKKSKEEKKNKMIGARKKWIPMK